MPAPGQPQYTAAKHGVLGLTKQAAQEFAAQGIRVNAVLPGQTETGPMRAYLDALPDQGERMLRRLPMGRMATPDEIAQTVVWLCSDDASLRQRRVAHSSTAASSPADRSGGRQLTSSAMTSSASGCCAPRIIVVTPASRHAPRRSAMRSFGPSSATSSIISKGTAAAASCFLPSR